MSIENIIEEAWENKDQVNQNSDQKLKDAINQVIEDARNGNLLIAAEGYSSEDQESVYFIEDTISFI